MKLLVRLLSLSCVLITSSPLLAQTIRITRPPASQSIARPAGRIAGTVTCDDTQKPARGALVMLVRAEGPELGQSMTRTGMDGHFLLKHVAPGEYALLAILPGYLNPMDSLTLSGSQDEGPVLKELYASLTHVTVREGEVEAPGISITRGAAVSGHVVFSDGSPATQVTLAVEPVSDKPVQGQTAPIVDAGVVMRGLILRQTSSTDDQGHFRIAGLTPGKYTVAVQQSGAFGDEDSNFGDGFGAAMGLVPNTHNLHFYSGDTVHRKKAKVFELRAGEETSGIEISIPLDALHTLRGTVTATDGRVINAGSIHLQDADDDSFSLEAAIDSEGFWAFREVPNGSYKVTLTSPSIRREVDSAAIANNAPLPPPMLFTESSQTVIVKDNDVTLPVMAGKQIDTTTPVAPPQE